MKNPLLVAFILPLIGTIGSFAVQPGQKPLLGSNTAILFIMDSCPPCYRAKEIITQMQAEGFDVVIIKNRGIAKSFNVYSYPTLMVRKNGRVILRKIGLLNEQEYRSLIPFKK